MPEPTINLQQGLEGWYDLGETYYDSQRNVLEDKSGYGRGITPRNGVSIRNRGYAGFESVQFDGSDDIIGVGTGGRTVDVVTGAVLLNRDTDKSIFGEVYGRGGRYRIKTNSDGTLSWWTNDENDNIVEKKISVQDGWLLGIGSYNKNNDEITFYVYDYTTGEATIKTDTNTLTGQLQLAETLGGGYNNTDSLFDGKVSLFAQWSRELNRAEKDYIASLTGPRRAQL